jgi:hypothetical protein
LKRNAAGCIWDIAKRPLYTAQYYKRLAKALTTVIFLFWPVWGVRFGVCGATGQQERQKM